jgi:hypothetical protein
MDEILLGGMEMGMSSHYSMNGEWRIRNEKLEMRNGGGGFAANIWGDVRRWQSSY